MLSGLSVVVPSFNESGDLYFCFEENFTYSCLKLGGWGQKEEPGLGEGG